jgi:hypothetical protein
VCVHFSSHVHVGRDAALCYRGCNSFFRQSDVQKVGEQLTGYNRDVNEQKPGAAQALEDFKIETRALVRAIWKVQGWSDAY